MPAFPPANCDWSTNWPAELAKDGPIDVAVVYSGSWDVQDRSGAPLGSAWSHLGQAPFDEWLLGEMRASTRLLLDHGAGDVVWLTIGSGPDGERAPRVERYNALLTLLAAAEGAHVHVVDLAGWIAATGEAARLLPDGVHATWDPDGGTAREIGDEFLDGAIAAAVGR
jgi:hypothetical protein